MAVAAQAGPVRWGKDVKTLTAARREFARKRSPWLILAAVAIAAGARVALGDLGWGDAIGIAGMLIVYPFGEWAIHVYLLHMKPVEIRGRRIEPPAAREHRAHHRKPNDLTMILLMPKEVAQLLFGAVPFTLALGSAIVLAIAGSVPLGPLISATFTAYVLIGIYEWTHFLIHTAHRPKSRYYRAIWRNHRLHHFKNEHYWHGITNNVSDKVLGTDPSHRDVPRSRTARTLDAGPA